MPPAVEKFAVRWKPTGEFYLPSLVVLSNCISSRMRTSSPSVSTHQIEALRKATLPKQHPSQLRTRISQNSDVATLEATNFIPCSALHASGGELEQIQFLLGHASVQTTERYLGCKQRIRSAVNDRIGIEPNP